MKEIVDQEHLECAKKMIQVLSTYREAEDLIHIGAYSEGSDTKIDFAKEMIGKINAFLQQDIYQKVNFKESIDQLQALFT
jgi:flagellum-specific ATP synthase